MRPASSQLFAILIAATLAAAVAPLAAQPTRPQRPQGTRPAPPSGTQRATTTARTAPTGALNKDELAAKRTQIQAKLPQPSATQQKNLDALKTDLQEVGSGVKNAEDEIRALGQDLQGMGLQKPDQALSQELARDLQSTMADAQLSPQEMAQLSQDFYAVMNSAGLSQQELNVIKQDVQEILTSSGVDQNDAQEIAADLQAIYDEAQQNSPR